MQRRRHKTFSSRHQQLHRGDCYESPRVQQRSSHDRCAAAQRTGISADLFTKVWIRWNFLLKKTVQAISPPGPSDVSPASKGASSNPPASDCNLPAPALKDRVTMFAVLVTAIGTVTNGLFNLRKDTCEKRREPLETKKARARNQKARTRRNQEAPRGA